LARKEEYGGVEYLLSVRPFLPANPLCSKAIVEERNKTTDFSFGQEQFVTLPRCGRVCNSARRREERKVEL
jgi:hypothetical protein